MDLTYEDVGDPDPNPTGVGRSYEITLQVVSSTPSRQTLAQLASVNVSPSLTPYVTPRFDIVCLVEGPSCRRISRILSVTPTLGWTMVSDRIAPDVSTPLTYDPQESPSNCPKWCPSYRKAEERFARLLHCGLLYINSPFTLTLILAYIKEIEQRQFYGFWDFGDVMHTYGTISKTICFRIAYRLSLP